MCKERAAKWTWKYFTLAALQWLCLYFIFTSELKLWTETPNSNFSRMLKGSWCKNSSDMPAINKKAWSSVECQALTSVKKHNWNVTMCMFLSVGLNVINRAVPSLTWPSSGPGLWGQILAGRWLAETTEGSGGYGGPECLFLLGTGSPHSSPAWQRDTRSC